MKNILRDAGFETETFEKETKEVIPSAPPKDIAEETSGESGESKDNKKSEEVEGL